MLDALTLDQMRTFVAVADAGRFRAAAIRLARVQSAVSHAISNLEDQLGVALFDRTGHRPILTAEGRAPSAPQGACSAKRCCDASMDPWRAGRSLAQSNWQRDLRPRGIGYVA
jgi:hypothetical protein